MFESAITIHTFSDKILDIPVYFQVTKLTDSFHLWVGSPPLLGNMAVAMSTRHKVPCGSHLIGNSDSHSLSLAKKLALKSGKQIFVSSNLPNDQLLLPLVEKRLIEEMKQNPDKF